MNKTQLIELLNELAEEDMAEGSEIYDHPCSVAIRALNKCFDDIKLLREISNGFHEGKSKRAKILLVTNYNPEW